LVKVISTSRKSAVLSPSRLACLAQTPTVNLTRGCAHGCVYCYARGYSGYPGDGTVVVYADTLEKLRRELSRKRRRPAAVYFSPSCDAFQPVPEVLELAYRAFELLLREGIGVAILTKGAMPEEHLALLARHAPLVRVQVGITTLDRETAGCLEPRAAAPETRLAQMRRLLAAGVETQARLDPIIPGVTDDEASIDALCAGLARVGVRQVAAGMLFLRPAILHALQRELRGNSLLDRILAPFAAGEQLEIQSEGSRVTALPAAARETAYGRIRAIAGRYAISVRVCACKNPDIARGSCRIAGRWDTPPARELQPGLFK